MSGIYTICPFCDWLISLSTTSSGSMRFAPCARTSFLAMTEQYPIMRGPIWAVLSGTVRARVCRCSFMSLLSVPLGVYPGVGLPSRVCGSSVLAFRGSADGFPQQPQRLAAPAAAAAAAPRTRSRGAQGFQRPHPRRHLLFSMCLATAVLVSVEWPLPVGFDLQFPSHWWCWASVHVCVSHLCFFFGEISLNSFFN